MTTASPYRRARTASGSRTAVTGAPSAQLASARTAISVDRIETRYRPKHPLDLLATVAPHRRGAGDPTMLIAGAVVWRATLTPAGVATLALRQSGADILAAAWGPGASEALDQVPRLCGADDTPELFDPGEIAFLRETHRRHPGLRIGATDNLSDAVVSAILEQKVTGMQAFGAWRFLVMRHGIAAPGPTPRPLVAAPDFAEWSRIPSWSWHRAGVEPPQSKTIVRTASRGNTVSRALHEATSGAERERVLTALPGIGAWTSAEVRIRAYGDPDAVSVGDFHLAHHVGYAFTGTRTDDAGMLALLQPWAGQRQRVIRLIMRSGRTEPRRGARLAPEDHRER